MVFFLIIQTVHRINRAMTISAMAEATTPPPTAAPLTPDLPPVLAMIDAINRNYRHNNLICPKDSIVGTNYFNLILEVIRTINIFAP